MPYYFTRMLERFDRTNSPLHVELHICISGNDTFSSHLFLRLVSRKISDYAPD